MELLAIRHARPQRADVAADPADPGLDEEGRRQAAALAAWLGPLHVDVVYTSPLRRARETAAPLGDALGLTPVVVDDLAEWDRDAPAYLHVEDLKAANHPWWRALATGDFAELGVDVDAFRRRVVESFDAIASRHPGGTAAVVCHGGVINALAADVLGLDRVLFFEPAYTSVSRLLIARSGQRSLRSLNETGHLGPGG